MNDTFFHLNGFILGQGSMHERLRRSADLKLDPQIFHAGLVYGDEQKEVLQQTLCEYLDIGQLHAIPMMATTPTWRANAERIALSRCAGSHVNRDCVQFMFELKQAYGPNAHPIIIGGTTGPKGDGYIPAEAPPREGAIEFHRPQINELASAGVDYLIAKTLPAFDEALGIAQCMSDTDTPYIISFVLRPNGTLLDGTLLEDAMDRIDNETARIPETYFANCVHASVFSSALKAVEKRQPGSTTRISGLDPNTSAKSPEELDGLDEIDTQAPDDFGENLWDLKTKLGVTYLGGCCGSSTEHIAALAQKAVAAGPVAQRKS